MNDEDKKAFEAACKDWATKSAGKDLGEYFWKAALEWRDGQVGESIAWFVMRNAPGKKDHGMKLGPFWKLSEAEQWLDDNHTLHEMYTTPPTAQINQRLVEALQFVIDCQESTNGSDYQSGSALREAASMAQAALTAAKSGE